MNDTEWLIQLDLENKLDFARHKIDELKQEILELKQENKRLIAILKQEDTINNSDE